MSFSFDLTSERWIPCIMHDGKRVELGLRDVLCKAPQIREIFDASPPVTASLHRLLLAILHRKFGPKNSTQWKKMWDDGMWDADALQEYFDTWQHRFDLFHPERPFYQMAGMAPKMLKAIALLAYEMASGNNATLFGHNLDDEPPGLSPAFAARLVVAQQSYALGGLVGTEKGQTSTTSAPVAGGACIIMKGENLFQTLMLNLLPYNPDSSEPMPCTPADLPAWEQKEPCGVKTRLPDGYLDYLTWQSRRLFVQPQETATGSIEVKKAIFSNGCEFSKDFYSQDPLMAFVAYKNAKPGQNPWGAVRFNENRALWRESTALLQSVDQQAKRPQTVEFLSKLVAEEVVPKTKTCRLDILGLGSKQAKVFFWRHERLPLPLVYLEHEKLVEVLAECIHHAETTSDIVRKALWKLAYEFLLNNEGLEPEKKSVETMLNSFPGETLYWSTLEAEFYSLMENLAKDPDKTEPVATGWYDLLRKTAREAFEHTANQLKPDARALRAVIAARIFLNSELKKTFEDIS